MTSTVGIHAELRGVLEEAAGLTEGDRGRYIELVDEALRLAGRDGFGALEQAADGWERAALDLGLPRAAQGARVLRNGGLRFPKGG